MTNQLSNYAIAFTAFYILKRSHYLLSPKSKLFIDIAVKEIIDSTKFLLQDAAQTPLGGCRYLRNKYQIYQEVSDIP
ncbi:hypothetical protein [uncultured Nostoc sp.]|uniref:hypothetical protein n=1 Tax=uncultured Nostoc sp. TaxID=340711 RepID=UPI00262A7358|nr:hypothetical protein [uncultured Nostoc sp.]